MPTRDNSSPPTGRYRDEKLPSYNELYQLENAGQSSTTQIPPRGYPHVGGLDFSSWENHDPEGDACFAAVSGTSRSSEEMMGNSGYDKEEGRDTGELSTGRSGENDQLVDVEDAYSPQRFPPNHRPDYHGLTSYVPLTPSRPSTSHHQTNQPDRPAESSQAEYIYDSEESSLSAMLYKPDHESSLEFNTGSGPGTSKRKYDEDEEGYKYYEEATADLTTQPGLKRFRMRTPSSTPEYEAFIDTQLQNDDTTPLTSMEVGDEWQGDSLTRDSSDSGDGQSNSSRGEQIQFETTNPHQRQTEQITYRDDIQSNSTQEENIELTTYIHHQPQSGSITSTPESQSDESNPDSANGEEQWPSDGLTIVDPSADWIGHEHDPIRTSQQHSDDSLEEDQNRIGIQSPALFNHHPESEFVPESPMIVEPSSTFESQSPDFPLPEIVLTESRKRPAEEVSSTVL